MLSSKAESVWNLMCEEVRWKISQEMQDCLQGAACSYCKERIVKDWDELDQLSKKKISHYVETHTKYPGAF